MLNPFHIELIKYMKFFPRKKKKFWESFQFILTFNEPSISRRVQLVLPSDNFFLKIFYLYLSLYGSLAPKYFPIIQFPYALRFELQSDKKMLFFINIVLFQFIFLSIKWFYFKFMNKVHIYCFYRSLWESIVHFADNICVFANIIGIFIKLYSNLSLA